MAACNPPHRLAGASSIRPAALIAVVAAGLLSQAALSAASTSSVLTVGVTVVRSCVIQTPAPGPGGAPTVTCGAKAGLDVADPESATTTSTGDTRQVTVNF